VTLQEKYRKRHDTILVPVAAGLQQYISDHFASVARIDRIAARAKAVDSFLNKAKKQKKGKPVYSDPLGQIQDQIGARINVFYTSDVEPTVQRIQKYFTHIEQLWKEPKRTSEFGYFGRHLMLQLPPDCVPEHINLDAAPNFFELQIRTLFQHAWSEGQHDLAYKSKKKLTPAHDRKFAFTAAQAWGADLLFAELCSDLSPTTPPLPVQRRK